VADNPPLDPDSEYSVFYRAEVNDDVAIVSDWYQPVITRPPGKEGM